MGTHATASLRKKQGQGIFQCPIKNGGIKINKKNRALKQYKEGNITAAFGNDLLTSGITAIPNMLLKKYKFIGIKDNELPLLIQLLRLETKDRKLSSVTEELEECLNAGKLEITSVLNELVEKGILGITRYYDEDLDQVYEGYDLEPLFSKLSELWACSKAKELFKPTKKKPSVVTDINNPKVSKLFTAFEEEFGRPLSPMEIEQIKQWFNDVEVPLILEALKHAVLRGKYNFRYIDRILLNWQKNNIRTIREVMERDSKQDKQTDSKETERKELIKSLYLS